MSDVTAAATSQLPLEPEVGAWEGEDDKPRRRFKDLSPVVKGVIVVVGLAQAALAFVAIRDLVRRPARLVRGPKLAWAPAMAVNTVGPLAYLRFGRLEPSRLDTLRAAPAAAAAAVPAALHAAPGVARAGGEAVRSLPASAAHAVPTVAHAVPAVAHAVPGAVRAVPAAVPVAVAAVPTAARTATRVVRKLPAVALVVGAGALARARR